MQDIGMRVYVAVSRLLVLENIDPIYVFSCCREIIPNL